MINSLNLYLIDLNTTHHTASSHTIIDLIIDNDRSIIEQFGQREITGLSNHDMIYVILKIATTRYPQIEYSSRNLRQVESEKLRNGVEKYSWILIENMNC